MEEAKILESGRFVVTTQRFVYGSSTVQLSEVDVAIPFINRGWAGMFIIFGIGLVMMLGGTLWKLAGFLTLLGALAFFRYTIHRDIILSMKEGESEVIAVPSTELLRSLVSAINKALQDRQNRSDVALRNELASLPDAE